MAIQGIGGYPLTPDYDALMNHAKGRFMTHMSMLQMRMRWGEWSIPGQPTAPGVPIQPFPFDHVEVVYGSKDFIVLVVKDGEPVTIRDSHELFPSDTLVTQLRMLEGR